MKPIDEAAQAGVRAVQVLMKRNAADLEQLAKLVDQRHVKPRMGGMMSLAQAKEAQELSEKGGIRGKLILKVA